MLVGKEVAVEVKNDSVLIGTLHSVNQDLNVKLTNVTVVDSNKYWSFRKFLPVACVWDFLL